jgi:hypothetical protein
VSEKHAVDMHGNTVLLPPGEPLEKIPDMPVSLEHRIRAIVREEVHKALAEEVKKIRMYGGRYA